MATSATQPQPSEEVIGNVVFAHTMVTEYDLQVRENAVPPCCLVPLKQCLDDPHRAALLARYAATCWPSCTGLVPLVYLPVHAVSGEGKPKQVVLSRTGRQIVARTMKLMEMRSAWGIHPDLAAESLTIFDVLE